MASGFLGVALARWASAPRPIWRLAFAGILLVLTGLLTTIVIPINKDLWTASFVLVTSGIGASGYAAVRAAWPVLQPHGWAKQFVAVGQAALTIYVIHMLLIALLRLPPGGEDRSEEHTSELQSLMRISYAVFCLKKKNIYKHNVTIQLNS